MWQAWTKQDLSCRPPPRLVSDCCSCHSLATPLSLVVSSSVPTNICILLKTPFDATQGSSHRSNTMRGQRRGLWSWGLSDADARRPAGASQRSSVRNLFVCGLLLLTLPASSTDVQHSSFPALQCGAERHSAATASRAMPSFVGVRAARGFPVHSLPHVCRRRPQSSAAPSLHVMVSVQARTGSAGESSTQTRVRQTQASSIADGVNASLKSVVERRVANARKELEASVA